MSDPLLKPGQVAQLELEKDIRYKDLPELDARVQQISDRAAADAVAGLKQEADPFPQYNAGAAGVFYIDSVAGSDLANGTSINTPKKTLASVTLSDFITIRLKCGSHFAEQIDASAFAGVTVESYGSGPLPKLDAADTIAGTWTKTAGRTNVYQVDVPHSLSGSSMHHVWEEGVQLVSVADLAACDSTPGSLYAASPSGATQTIYVHSFESTDPRSDAKLREYSRRMYGIYIGNFGTVRRIHTTRNGSEDGSLCGVNRTDVLFEDCIASHGSKHNVSIGSGVCRRVSAYGCDTRSGSGTATMFVAYLDDPAGSSALFDTCTAIAGSYASWAVGFFGHGGSNPYSSLTFRNCSVTWFANSFGGEALQYVVTGGSSLGCSALFDGGSSTAGESYIAGHFFSNADQSWGVAGAQTIRGYSAKLTIRNCEIVTRTGGDSMIWPRTDGCALTVENCTLQYPSNSAGYPLGIIHSTSGIVIYRNNVSSGYTHAMMLSAGVALTAANNIYGSTGTWTWNGVDYGTFAEYVAASSQDAGSLQTDPLASCIGSRRTVWGKGSPIIAAAGQIGATEATDLSTASKLVALGITQ